MPLPLRLWSCVAGCVFGSFALLVQANAPVSADEFPSRTVKLVMGFGAGGLGDIAGRAIGQVMSRSIGQPVVIENMPGAGGATAALSVARAAPDGHAMLWVSSQNAISRSMFKSMPYEWSRDFTPVHHDVAAAQAQGMQNVFMNILTTNGLVGRYVTDWAGPDAILKGVNIKLGAPNFPGDTMKMTGTVKAKDENRGVVEVAVVGTNAWGDHVTGTVTVALPARA